MALEESESNAVTQSVMEIHEDCSDLAEGLWNKLNEDLKLEILARLPVESVYKFRCVCKKWNVRLSNEFISKIWANVPVNSEPWLIVRDVFSCSPSMAYCFYTKTWKNWFSISMSIHRRGSAAGLLLVDKDYSCTFSNVYNPYRRTHFKLPPTLKIDLHVTKAIVQTDSDSYKVVAAGIRLGGRGAASSVVVEIYESRSKSWRFAGQIPKEFGITHDMILLDDTLYCRTTHCAVQGILGFSISGPAGIPLFFVPFPQLLRNSSMLYLINCGSRILVAAARIDVQDLLEGNFMKRTIAVWELEKDHGLGSCWWKEIATMPLSLYEDMMESSDFFHCVGVGETWICFKSLSGKEQKKITGLVVTYNLGNMSWSLLPRCPIPEWSHQTLLAFEPRPNMVMA